MFLTLMNHFIFTPYNSLCTANLINILLNFVILQRKGYLIKMNPRCSH